MQPLSNTVYHYTSMEAFYNIVDSEGLWATDVRQANDSTEHLLGLEDLLAVYKELVDSHASETQVVARTIFDMIWTFAPDLIDQYPPRSIFKDHVETWVNSAQRKSTPFIFSASKFPDDLSQWRSYANDGTGVSVGFDLDQLKSGVHGANKRSEWLEMQYDIDVFRNRLKESIQSFTKSVNSSLEVESKKHLVEDLGFQKLVLSRKHRAFRHEEEMRLQIVTNRTTDEDFQYRMIRGKIKSIMVLKPNMNLALREVVLGPKNTMINEGDILVGFLKKKGLNAQVKKSIVPYR